MASWLAIHPACPHLYEPFFIGDYRYQENANPCCPAVQTGYGLCQFLVLMMLIFRLLGLADVQPRMGEHAGSAFSLYCIYNYL